MTRLRIWLHCLLHWHRPRIVSLDDEIVYAACCNCDFTLVDDLDKLNEFELLQLLEDPNANT